MRQLTDGVIQGNAANLLNSAAEETTKEIFNPIDKVVEDIDKKTVNFGAADNVISSRLDKLSDSQELTQNIVSCLMKTSTLTAPVTK